MDGWATPNPLKSLSDIQKTRICFIVSSTGDIMLAVDITEEIVTHAQKRGEPAQIQEVEVIISE